MLIESRRSLARPRIAFPRASALAAARVVATPAATFGQDADGNAAAQPITAPETPAVEDAELDLSSEEAARAAEVFEEHIEAMGGRDAVFGVDKRVIRGSYEGQPLKFPGRLRMTLEAPDKLYWEISEPAGLSITTVYNGEQAWSEVKAGVGEPRMNWIIGPPLLDLIESASFYGEADYKNRYRELAYVGTADFYGSVCHVIRGIRKSGKLHLLFFDTKTKLYKGARTAVLHESGEVRPLDVRIGDWAEVDGVMVPKVMIQQFRGESISNLFTMSRITHVDDTGIDWSPPEELGEWPELDEFYLPKGLREQREREAEQAESP